MYGLVKDKRRHNLTYSKYPRQETKLFKGYITNITSYVNVLQLYIYGPHLNFDVVYPYQSIDGHRFYAKTNEIKRIPITSWKDFPQVSGYEWVIGIVTSGLEPREVIIGHVELNGEKLENV